MTQNPLNKQSMPHSIEAEESLLASCLLDSKARDQAFSVVDAKDFYQTKHQKIFSVLMKMHASGEDIDLVTVYEKCRDLKIDKAIGGAAYLSKLIDSIPVSSNPVAHAQIIREKADLRRIIVSAHDMANKCMNANQQDAGQIISSAWEDFISRTNREVRPDRKSMELNHIVLEAIDDLETLCVNRNKMPVIRSGFTDIDLAMHGFMPSDFIVLAARPGMGKTALVTAIAEHNAEQGMPIGIFSLEMSRKQLGYRLIAKRAGINTLKFRSGMISKDEWDRIVEASGDLSQMPLYIDDTGDLSVAGFRQRARAMHKLYGVKLIITDYMQLMRAFEDGRPSDQNTEVATISKAHKAIAKELGIPVIGISQLNRKLEERNDKRPKLSDLRSSGQLEQDADAILFLFRQSVYSKDKQEQDAEDDWAEVIIAKQRNGPTTTVHLGFHKRTTNFYSLQE
jgi:replicative DNA helicase